MEPVYVLILVLIVSLAVIFAFKTGYSIGCKKSNVPEKKPNDNASLFDNVKEFILDTIYSVSRKKEKEDNEVKTVTTVDGINKDVRRFFT